MRKGKDIRRDGQRGEGDGGGRRRQKKEAKEKKKEGEELG